MALRGNLLIGQGGGPTAVINASLLGVVREAQRHEEIGRILGARFGLLGLLNDDMIDLGQENDDVLERVARTPASALGTCRRRFSPADAGRALAALAAHDVRYFLYIGGNDSADTAHQIQMHADAQAYPLCCIGVPKTTDNDLALMDHTPGYGSIARYVAMATQDVACDAAAIVSSYQVTLLEVMGRNAGWVAAASALARRHESDAPDLILVPELPVIADDVVRRVQNAVDQWDSAVVVVTETVRDEHGEPWARASGRDDFGHPRLAGAAERLSELISERTGLQTRFNKPGTLQRSAGACVSPVDWEEARLAGEHAVAVAVSGARDMMVTLVRPPAPVYQCSLGVAPLNDVAHAERRLPPEFLTETGEITPAFLSWLRPLVGGDLPGYARLAGMETHLR
jgi:ATP-dependent phosphofructokinase / diphosphate-dependent phosphofructokinase